jgi:predicted enzyme related to lactoylglutathione lyase
LRLFEVPADPDGTPPPTNGNRPGDLSYLTLETVDSGRARAFYGTVLGWTFHRGSIDDGWQVTGPALMTGFSGGHEEAAAVPMWSVADVEEAVRGVRAHGGIATEPERQPYGVTSTCADDQGLRFYLGELS